jgi:hypothetical protein
LISPRVTSGEPITSTTILNEKEPRRQASGLWLNINTPGKDWGGAFRALISGRYRSIVRGSSAAESPASRRGSPIITAPAAASAGRAPRARSTARATRRRRTCLATRRKCAESHRAPEGASSCNQPVTASPQIRSRRARPHDPRRKLQLAAACGVKFLIAHTAPIILDGPPARELNYQPFAHHCGLRIMPALNSRAADAAFVCRKPPIVLG